MDHQNIRFHNVEELEPVEGGWLLRRVGAAARARISPGVQENCFATGIELRFTMPDGAVDLLLKTIPQAEAATAHIFFGSFQGGWEYSSKNIGADVTRIHIEYPAKLATLRRITAEKQLAFAPEVVRVVLPYVPVIFAGVEGRTALPAADGSNTSSYYNSALFGQETIFPNAPGKNDRHLYGRPLYADPENDEMVFGAISNNKLVLRYATALTTEIDLFNPINTTRVKKTEERDLSDFLQADHFSYSAVSYDVDADKICVVSTPGADQLKTTGLIRVRTYDRKTLEEKNYAFTNPTGVTLAGNVGGTSPGLRNTGRLLGGCLFMAGYTTSPSANAVPFFKIPLADPSNVTAITTHDLLMPMFQDMHDGRIYFMGSRYTACGTVLNTATNEMHAIEAYYNYEQYPYLAVPVLGQPAVPYMVRYDANSGNNQSTVHQGIRRNYLATINDLDAPVQKTADKTMKITYTLRREES